MFRPLRMHLAALAAAAALVVCVALVPADGDAPNVSRWAAALADDDGGEGAGGPGGGGPGGGGPGAGPSGADGPSGGPGRDAAPGFPRGQRFYWPWERPPQRERPARARAPLDAVPNELVMAVANAADVGRLRSGGFTIIAERNLGLVPVRVLRVRIPRGMTVPRALARARAIVPGAIVERNHLFRQVFRAQGAAAARQRAFADPLGAVDWPALTACSDGLAIGMVDTPVQGTHAAFAGKSIETLSLRSAGRRPASSTHGTAIAALLLGHGEHPGLLPGARLIAADAFHRRDGADVADAFDLVAALDALFARQVPVINVSLAGPPNALLDAAGTALRQRGVILVAATGNDGAASGPRYPAAYGWAVAVTAVDDAQAVYDRAGRGDHVAFAAPGVRLRAPTASGTGVVTGTSFATPFVTAAIALLASVDAETQPVELLITAARDLGGPGRDPIYGHGLLRMPRGCSVADLRE